MFLTCYVINMIAVSTILWDRSESKGQAMLAGLLWPLLILVILFWDDFNDED